MEHPGQIKARRALPLELSNSWPLYEQPQQFELGQILNSVAIDMVAPSAVGDLSVQHAGCWECDLADQSLVWSGGIYDIFGLPRGARVTRAEAVGFYAEPSRAAMERGRENPLNPHAFFGLDRRGIRTESGETVEIDLVQGEKGPAAENVARVGA